MKIKTANVVILVSVVTILAVLAFFVRTGATADSVAVLRTVGMTCGSCSDSITKALESVRGVAVTEVDIEGGWVVVGYDTKRVKPEALAASVNGTGFGSSVHMVMTPEQFRQLTGRSIGAKAVSGSGCCGSKSGGGRGCSTNQKS